MSTAPARAPSSSSSASDQGPVGFVVVAFFGTIATVLFSWVLAIVIEMVGMHTLWKELGVEHSRNMVKEDLGYISAAPHSLFVNDTVAFAKQLIFWVAIPFDRLGVDAFYARVHAEADAAQQQADQAVKAGGKSAVFGALKRTAINSNQMLANLGVIAKSTAQDTALRLAIVIFALPAFLLACLMGAVDGLVRRDLRKWGGGRESSFIYHHAKATTLLALSGGFGLYLAWPFGGFNPAHMVLVFTVLVAWFLSLTLSSFKKYL